MAIGVLTDASIWMNQWDISGQSNVARVTVEREELAAPLFGSTATRVTAGLWMAQLSAQGLTDFAPGAIQNILRGTFGQTVNVITTVSPTGVDGSYAETFLARTFELKQLDDVPVGQLSAFAITAKSRGTVPVKGTLLFNSTDTANGTGTGRQLGSVAAGQSVYAGLHVFAASGTTPTLDVVIESDDNSGFTSAATRLTHAQKTTAGSDWQSAAGAITDDWWRVSYTITGGTPSFTFAVVVGIA